MVQKTPEDYARELIEMYRYKGGANGSQNTTVSKSANDSLQPPNVSDAILEDGVGGLVINSTTVGRLYPVEGVLVTVFTGDPDSMRIIGIDTTDESGKTGVFKLKTPPKSESQQATDSNQIPYANYNVSVRYDGYVEQIAMNVPVFPGVVSVQGVDLVPVSAAGKHTSPQIFQGGNKYNL